MKKLLLLAVVISLLSSCKAPLPIYFDKPIGISVDTFPVSMRGNYYPAHKIFSKGIEIYEKDYHIVDGKIRSQKDTLPPNPAMMQGQALQDTLADKFREIAVLNPIAFSDIFFKLLSNENPDLNFSETDSSLNKTNVKTAFYYFKILQNGISVVSLDSNGINHDVPLFKMSEKIKLTKYGDHYYINVHSENGWEYLQIVDWRGNLISVMPFYFTNYKETNDENAFINSTSAIYPKLKPIYNREHKIIGMNAKLDPKKVEAKFREVENGYELIRAGEDK